MKYKNSSIAKEQMKYLPTLPAKQSGNTSQKKEWIDQVQRNVTNDLKYRPTTQNTVALEQFESRGVDNSSVENMILARELRGDRGNTNRVNNNPQHRDATAQYTDDMTVNQKYDRTIDRDVLRDGYKLEQLDALECEYTGQHSTIFYDTVERKDKETGKTVTGFLERGNFLDRI